VTQPIGVAIIGCGLIAEEHARGYARSDAGIRGSSTPGARPGGS
jgi:predicted dehydrogenase